MTKEQILNFIIENTTCDSFEYLGIWEKYRVYNPTYSDGLEREEGILPFVLVNDDSIRLSVSNNETFEIMEYFS